MVMSDRQRLCGQRAAPVGVLGRLRQVRVPPPLEPARALLEAKASADVADKPIEETLLMEAVCAGSIEAVRLLLEHRADLSRPSEHPLVHHLGAVWLSNRLMCMVASPCAAHEHRP